MTDITPVQPKGLDLTPPLTYDPRPVEEMPVPNSHDTGVLDTIHTTFLWVKAATLATPHIVQLIYGLAVKNWKTTLTAIIGALAVVLNTLLGIVVPTESILTVALFVIGFFAKDGDVTGGTRQQ